METPEQIAEFNEILAKWRDDFVAKHKDMHCPHSDQHQEFFEIEDIHYTGWGAYSYHIKACCPAFEMEIQPLLTQEKMYNPPDLTPRSAREAEKPSVRTLTDNWFEQVWNKKSASHISEFMAPECKLHGFGPDIYGGAEGFAKFHKRMIEAIPDLHVRVQYLVVEDEVAGCLLHITGTHRGDLMGHAATGNKLEFTAMSFGKWHDGKLVDVWSLTDLDKVMLPAHVGV